MSKSKSAKTPPATAIAPATPAVPEALIGSGTQPAVFRLASGTELQLGTVVASAYEASGAASVAEWNALEDELREGFIQDIVDGLDLAEETPPATGDGTGEAEEDEGEADPDGTDATFTGSTPAQPTETPAPAVPAPKAWFWIRDINFGQHKPGDRFEGTEEEALAFAAKELVALK